MKDSLKILKITCIISSITVVLSAANVVLGSFGKHQMIRFCCTLVMACCNMILYYKKATEEIKTKE